MIAHKVCANEMDTEILRDSGVYVMTPRVTARVNEMDTEILRDSGQVGDTIHIENLSNEMDTEILRDSGQYIESGVGQHWYE